MEEDEREGWEPQIETCRIVLWRGYRTSSFYARPDGDGPGRSIGAPSTSFRLRGAAAPDSPEARLAHQDVVSRLQAKGWVETGSGDEWYATEFARTVFVPSSREEVADESESAVSEDDLEHEPELPPRTSLSEPVAPVRKPTTRRRLDRWRVAAGAGLAAAIAVVGWLAAHPSSLRAASNPPVTASAREAGR